MTSPFRFAPAMPAQAYVTYELARPLATHWRSARCEEVDCAAHRDGWITRLDVSTDLGRRQARYITERSGRSWTCPQAGSDAVIREYRFPAGQQCFAEHRLPLSREPLYIRRGGDWRGNPRGERIAHTRAEHWVEDFATHQDKLATEARKG